MAIHKTVKITKAQFDRYEAVRRRGKYNMLMEAGAAMQDANLSRDQYLTINKTYSELAEKYKEQRNAGAK